LVQLRVLLPQLADGSVELLIIDNHSPEPVATFLEGKIELPEFVRIIRNETNIGIDRNIHHCIKHAKTQWVWTLSDNDVLKPNAVEQVFAVIRRHRNSAFITLSGRPEVEAQGLIEYCRLVTYWTTYSCSHTAFNKIFFDLYEGYYDLRVDTHQSQLLTALKILADRPETRCTIANVDFINDPEPACWSKAAYVFDTSKVFGILRKDHPEQYHQILSTLGVQITRMQMGHLMNARAYEGLGIANYLRLVLLILRDASWMSLLDGRTPLVLVTLVMPSIYRKVRKMKGLCAYKFSDASRTMRWNY